MILEKPHDGSWIRTIGPIKFSDDGVATHIMKTENENNGAFKSFGWMVD